MKPRNQVGTLIVFSAVCMLSLTGAAAEKDARESDKSKRPKAPFKVLYNDDGINSIVCRTPWNGWTKRTPFTQKQLEASIDEVADKGVDAYLLAPGLGWVPWWQSKVVPDHYQWWMKKVGLKRLDGYKSSNKFTLDDRWLSIGDYLLKGGDMVKVLIERCRAGGIAPFVSFRVNDIHFLDNIGLTNGASTLVCQFYEEHPEYLLYPDHLKKTPKGFSHNRGQNWAIKAVRDYKFALIEELLQNYDLAGIELDFLRSCHSFDPTKTTRQQRVQIVTGFIRRVRKVLDETARTGKRRYLSVRIPSELDIYGTLGLDVRELDAVGVDMFNLSGWYCTANQNDVAEVRKLVPNKAIYLELTHQAACVYFTSGSDGLRYSTPSFPFISDKQQYTTAHLAYARGADGVSFFNFVYWRGFPFFKNPPFHVLKHMGDPQWLARRQSQHYWLGNWGWTSNRQLFFGNQGIESGKARIFTIDAAPHAKIKRDSGYFRMHTKNALEDNVKFTVTLHGEKLKPIPSFGYIFDNPYDGMISDAPRRRTWKVPTNLLQNGPNQFEIKLHSESKAEIVMLELAVDGDLPYTD